METAEVLKINLVLVGVDLLNGGEDAIKFRRAVGTDVVVAEGGPILGVPVSIPALGRTFALNKDRITLSLSPPRSVIERDYPDYDDLERLADVAYIAITTSAIPGEIQPQALGYNIELVYEPDVNEPASEYLAERLFASKVPGANEQWKLVGGSGKLRFEGEGKVWRVAIEPRFNDENDPRVFFTMNMHISEMRFPSRNEIRESFQEIWGQAHDFTSGLDAGAL